MTNLITETGAEKIRQIYRDICIAENAFKNDVGKPNGNFEQRRIGLEDVFFALEMYGDAREIKDEVDEQVWTRAMNPNGSIKYEQIEKKMELS